MKNKLLSIVIALSIFSKLPAQLLDAVIPIQFDAPAQLTKITSGYQLTGNSSQLTNNILIDGAAIRFSASDSTEIWFQFLDDVGNWSEKKKAKIFYEPNSDRFIASVLDSTLGRVEKMKYEARSSSTIAFISAGLYDKEDREPKLSLIHI